MPNYDFQIELLRSTAVIHIRTLASIQFEYAIYIYSINWKLKSHQFYEFSPFSQHAMHIKCILHSIVAIYVYKLFVSTRTVYNCSISESFSHIRWDGMFRFLVFGAAAAASILSVRMPHYGGAERCNCNQQLNMLFSIIHQIFAFNENFCKYDGRNTIHSRVGRTLGASPYHIDPFVHYGSLYIKLDQYCGFVVACAVLSTILN